MAWTKHADMYDLVTGIEHYNSVLKETEIIDMKSTKTEFWLL